MTLFVTVTQVTEWSDDHIIQEKDIEGSGIRNIIIR